MQHIYTAAPNHHPYLPQQPSIERRMAVAPRPIFPTPQAPAAFPARRHDRISQEHTAGETALATLAALAAARRGLSRECSGHIMCVRLASEAAVREIATKFIALKMVVNSHLHEFRIKNNIGSTTSGGHEPEEVKKKLNDDDINAKE